MTPTRTMPHAASAYAEGATFTIDYVTSRDSDAPAQQSEFSGSTLDGATALAESVLRVIAAGTPRGGVPVIGYLIRDEGGTVVRRLYKGLA